MELVNSLMEDSYERWYGLVNRAADPGAKIASKHSPAELEYFNKVVSSVKCVFTYYTVLIYSHF